MTDYQVVWPTGQLIDQGPEAMMIERFFVICNQLKAWSIPQEYLPRVEPIPERTQYPSSAKHVAQVWEPTPYQVERVTSRQFGWFDPCVICGQTFTQCPHDNSETEAFINRVKAWKKTQR